MLVEVLDAHAAERAEGGGAEGLVVRVAGGDLRDHTALPLLAYGPSPDDEALRATALGLLGGVRVPHLDEHRDSIPFRDRLAEPSRGHGAGC